MARRIETNVSDETNVSEQAVQPHVDEGSSALTEIHSDATLTHKAERVIQDHVLLAVGSGLIPGPGLDMVAAFTVQLTMLKRLAAVYDVPFRQQAAKSAVASVLGALGGAGAAMIAGASFLKAIPFVGPVIGFAGTSVSFGAFTYAVGKVFERHFELGGSFIDFDPKTYREYFREMRQRGRVVAQAQSADASAAQSKQNEAGGTMTAAARA